MPLPSYHASTANLQLSALAAGDTFRDSAIFSPWRPGASWLVWENNAVHEEGQCHGLGQFCIPEKLASSAKRPGRTDRRARRICRRSKWPPCDSSVSIRRDAVGLVGRLCRREALPRLAESAGQLAW